MTRHTATVPICAVENNLDEKGGDFYGDVKKYCHES